MEPRRAVRTQTLVAFALLLVAATLGQYAFVIATLAVLLGSYLLLEVTYRRRTLRFGHRRLRPRSDLDRLLRRALILGFTVSGVWMLSMRKPGWSAADTPFLVDVIVIAGAAVSSIVLLSSLIDWFWIMPKVSGMTGTAPCVVGGGGENFASLTRVWFFHRMITAFAVSGSAAAVTAFLAPGIESRPLAAVIAVLGSFATIVFSEYNGDPAHVLRKSWQNPEVTVGQLIRLRPGLTADLTDAYVVDASVNGFKFALLDAAYKSDEEVFFYRKGTDLSFEEAGRSLPSDRTDPACPSVVRCQAVNWYCFRNPLASDAIPKSEKRSDYQPAPLDFEDPDEPSPAA